MGMFKKKGQQPLLESVQRQQAPAAAAKAKGAATGSSSRKGSQASQLQLLPRFSRFQRVGSKDSADTRLSSVGSEADHAPEYEPPPPFEVLQGAGSSTISLPFRTAPPTSQQFHALQHEEEDDDTLTADDSLIRGGGAGAVGSSSVVDSDCGEYEPPPPTLLPAVLQSDAVGDDTARAFGTDHHHSTPADDDTVTVEGTFRQFVFDPAGGIAGVEERKSDHGTSDIFRIAAAATLSVQSTRSPAVPEAADRSPSKATLRRPSFDHPEDEAPTFVPVDPASVFNNLHDDETESAFDAQHPPIFPSLVQSNDFSNIDSIQDKSKEPTMSDIEEEVFGDFQTDDFGIDRSQMIVDELFSPERQRPASNHISSYTNPFKSGNSVDSTSFLDKGFPLRISGQSRKQNKRLDLASIGPLTRQPTDDKSVSSRGSRQSYAVSINQRHTPTRRRPKSPENGGDAFKVIGTSVRPYSAYANAAEGSVMDVPVVADKFASLTVDRVSQLDKTLSSAPRPRVNGPGSVMSNANATVFSRPMRAEEKPRDPFAFPLDEVENPVADPFKVGDDAGPSSAWDVNKTPTFETNTSDALIDSIRRASSKRSQDCDSSTRTPPRPDPSPRGRPDSSAGERAEATQKAPEEKREALKENKNTETLGIQPSGSDGAMEKPTGQLNRAILGSMLCRQMDSIASMESQQMRKPQPPPSQLLHKSRATASPLRPDPVKRDIARVPSTIEKCAQDDATVSDVTEAVSSHYLTSFEAWKSQARSALSHYSNLRMSYRSNGQTESDGITDHYRRQHPSNRVTWMNRVQEEHQRMFLASEYRADTGSAAGAAER